MNTVNTLWVLLSTVMVLLMVCGLSFFYSGLISSRNAINTLKMSFITLAIIPLIWWGFGYSLAFSGNNPYLGSFSDAFLKQSHLNDIMDPMKIPVFAFIMFQMMFAAISPAAMSGAIAERMKFNAYFIFIIFWSLIVYSTVAHWVWSANGWLQSIGAIDFAGGNVVHITTGFSALVLAIVLKPRKYKEMSYHHNIPFVLLGTSLLWFGWFGFNAGSALNVSSITVVAFLNTILATSAAVVVWIILSSFACKQPNIVGACIATLVGLVSITPAAGFVAPWAAVIIGITASVFCYYALKLQNRIKNKIDDALDVFICHGLAGCLGSVLTGVFASNIINNSVPNGLIYGNYHLIISQIIVIIIVVTFAMLATYFLIKTLQFFMEIRVSEKDEQIGLDLTQHEEEAYVDNRKIFLKQWMANSIHKKKRSFQVKKTLKK